LFVELVFGGGGGLKAAPCDEEDRGGLLDECKI